MASYCTIAEMRASIDKTSALDDATIQKIIDAASEVIPSTPLILSVAP